MKIFFKCVVLLYIPVLCFGISWNSSQMMSETGQKNKDAPSISPEQLARAKTLFAQRCTRCHAIDGSGQTVIGDMLDVPDLTDEKWWNDDISDERLTESIADGKNEMPPFGKKLTKQEIAALVAYVSRFNKSKH